MRKFSRRVAFHSPNPSTSSSVNHHPRSAWSEDSLLGRRTRVRESLRKRWEVWSGKFVQHWKNENSTFRHIFPTLVLIVYSFFGALVFLAVESRGSCPMGSFWTGLYYTVNIYTTIGVPLTIGYGNVVCCTKLGRAITMLYSILGVPMSLIALDKIGEIFVKWGGYAFTRIIYPLEFRRMQQLPFPFTLGLLLTLLWLVCSSVVLSMCEGLSMSTAMYLMSQSVTTVGLGDVYPQRTEFALLYFFILLNALALFSMCVNILTQGYDRLISDIAKKITQLYLKNLQDQDSEKELFIYEDDINHMSKKEFSRNYVKIVLKQEPYGKILDFFLGNRIARQLAKEIVQKMKRKIKKTQVYPKHFGHLCDAGGDAVFFRVGPAVATQVTDLDLPTPPGSDSDDFLGSSWESGKTKLHKKSRHRIWTRDQSDQLDSDNESIVDSGEAWISLREQEAMMLEEEEETVEGTVEMTAEELAERKRRRLLYLKMRKDQQGRFMRGYEYITGFKGMFKHLYKEK